MYDDFLNYIKNNNIINVDIECLKDYIKKLENKYKTAYIDEFVRECLRRRSELGLDLKQLIEFIENTNNEENIKEIIAIHKELSLPRSLRVRLIKRMNNEKHIKDLIDRHEEIELNGFYVTELIKRIDDEKYIMECIEKSKELGLNNDNLGELTNKIDNEEYIKQLIDKHGGSELEEFYVTELIKRIDDEEYRMECIENNKKLGLHGYCVKELIETIDNEKYIKQLIDNRKELGLDGWNVAKLIDKIDSKEYIMETIYKSKELGLDGWNVAKLIDKIDSKECIMEIIYKYKELGLSAWDQVQFHELYMSDNLDELIINKLINKINNEENIKEFIENNKDIGLYGNIVTELIKRLVNEEYIRECIKRYEELGLNGSNIVDLLLKIDNKEYIKELLERHEELKLSKEDLISLAILNKEKFAEMVTSVFSQTENIGVEWQNECEMQIHDKNNVILSSPTGSGKTHVFLQWAMEKEERPIFITAPIKALSNQRYRELKSQGINVGIETGDIKYVPKDCEIICCTQEIYDIKYTNIAQCTCIMDEFHYIFENDNRARAYIDSLHNSKAKNLLICSATFGNVEKFQEYVEKVSDREFYTYNSKSRLTKLNYKYNILPNEINDALIISFSANNCKSICKQLTKIRKDDENHNVDDTKVNQIQELYDKYNINNESLLKNIKYGLAYYYGNMTPKEKMFIEKLYEHRLIDTVVGTDALALGVNFPIQNVVFAQIVKYGGYNSSRISKNLFEQLAGRAGRKGYYDEGFVYFCDDFVNDSGYPIEASGFSTSREYMELLMSDNEDIEIMLHSKIGSILRGETTIEEECDYINRYSTKERNVRSLIENVMELKESYKEELHEAGDITLESEFEENIGDVYSENFSPDINFSLFTILLKGKETYNYENEYGVCQILKYLITDEISDVSEFKFYDLMQMKEYIKQLPRKYRKNINISKLNQLINCIDETALSQGEGMLTMENLREGISERKSIDR